MGRTDPGETPKAQHCLGMVKDARGLPHLQTSPGGATPTLQGGWGGGGRPPALVTPGQAPDN